MNITFMDDHIMRQMKQRGYGDAYCTEIRHFIIAPGDVLKIDGGGTFFFLAEDAEMVTIKSIIGTYDLAAQNITELKYEHQGKITVTNNAAFFTHVLFIQVILIK